MEFLLLGIIIGSFSLDGTVKILSKSNMSDVRYRKGNKVFICENENSDKKEITVSSFRRSGELDFVKFNEIETKEEVESLKGSLIMVEKDSSILNEGYYFFSDLEQCSIVNNGQKIGIVKKVEEFPAQITLRVTHASGKEFFIPFIKEFINSVSIEKKEIDVNIIEGML